MSGVRVQGENVDVFKDAFFADGKDEVTIEILIPINTNYSITVLALGGGQDTTGDGNKETNLLLGAGIATGISVTPDETTFVIVDIAYKYNFNISSQVKTGEQILLNFEIQGPLLEVGWSYKGYINYSTILPKQDIFFGAMFQLIEKLLMMIIGSLILSFQVKAMQVLYICNLELMQVVVGLILNGIMMEFYQDFIRLI